MRYACIGHRVYFENHFIEGHGQRPDVQGFDYDHYSFQPFARLLAFAPDVTLVYRPELYSASMLRLLPGIKIGFSSEPLPTGPSGRQVTSGETDVRELVYRKLPASGYDMFFHYDQASQPWFDERGVAVDGYRPLPIDCSVFHPFDDVSKDIDFLFVGKATPHRIETLERFRTLSFRFHWIAHGVFGRSLADITRRARCVINVHADGRHQFEPRVLLAAACGTAVLSEPLGTRDFPCRDSVYQRDLSSMSVDELHFVLQQSDVSRTIVRDEWSSIRTMLSATDFVRQCVSRYFAR